ncbi:hypothetical protein [Henriciella sp.]|uniref:hypothetical protein n=1 Tax=Henriciella sp. TaxID=1968823 RepID=UPI00261C1D2E|nr:hypothetical protein [Henriciella sp.]
MTVSRMILAALSAGILASGPALAGEVHLTSAEKATVTQACETGISLIPVRSDFGHDTGNYALPITEDNGDVRSALIVSQSALNDTPECKMDVDAIAEQQPREDDNRIS